MWIDLDKLALEFLWVGLFVGACYLLGEYLSERERNKYKK